jgi:FlaG/FlaF family flagellin (archaellin)
MKKTMRIFRDRRAITPVLSSLLLTVVAVAAMSIATTATYVITMNMRETMSERIAIEDVWFNNSTNNINIYLRNVGKVAVSVSAVYVNHTQSQANPYRLGIGDHGWLNVTKSWEPGNVYYIDIVTTRGNHFPATYKT